MDKTTAMLGLTTAVSVLEAARKGNLNVSEKGGKLDKAKSAALDVNKAIISERIEQLIAIADTDGRPAFFSEYINHKFVTGVKIEQDDTSGVFFVGDAKKRVLFSSIDNASKRVALATNCAWAKYMRIFCDNIVLEIAYEKGETSAFGKDALPTDLMEMRKRIGWGKHSMTALAEQLNALVGMILPAENAVHMIKADVKFIREAALNTKSESADAAGSLYVASDKKLESVIFTAIYTRLNSLSYSFQNEQPLHEKKDQKAGDMNAKKPDAGDVSTDIGEKPTTETAKKPTTETAKTAEKPTTETAKTAEKSATAAA